MPPQFRNAAEIHGFCAAVPMVRIHLPPAQSLQTIRFPTNGLMRIWIDGCSCLISQAECWVSYSRKSYPASARIDTSTFGVTDRPQPELPHQPPEASTADRNPLSQQRHLKAAAAVDWIIGKNSVEPLQNIQLLRRFRPRPVVKAAARNPEQRTLPAYGQPHFRRDHRPPRSTREMAGCPARKSHSTCSCPILRCKSSITFCASSVAGVLLPRANSSPARASSR
jgi:hypothetical protein